MRRGLTLYGLWLLTWWHRLRHDLGRELTVAAASLIMFGTFLYVFNDFLNVQIASIAMAMQAAFAHTLTIVVLILAWSIGLYWIQKREPRGVASMALYLGESRSVITLFRWLQSLTIIALWHGLAWWLSARYLARWGFGTSLATELIMLATTAIAWSVLVRLRPNASLQNLVLSELKFDQSMEGPANKLGILADWRLAHILHRSRLCHLLMLIALSFACLITISVANAGPLFVACVCALATGFLLAAMLNVQMAADLRHAWLERGLGVSHDDFMSAFQKVATYLAITSGILTLIAYGLGLVLTQTPPSLLSGSLAALRVAAVAAVPALITPSLLLQVDGRRLAVSLPLDFVVCLFVGTAVIAHWLGLALVPLLISTARSSQAGRFYRA